MKYWQNWAGRPIEVWETENGAYLYWWPYQRMGLKESCKLRDHCTHTTCMRSHDKHRTRHRLKNGLVDSLSEELQEDLRGTDAKYSTCWHSNWSLNSCWVKLKLCITASLTSPRHLIQPGMKGSGYHYNMHGTIRKTYQSSPKSMRNLRDGHTNQILARRIGKGRSDKKQTRRQEMFPSLFIAILKKVREKMD